MKKYLTLLCTGFIFLLMFVTPGNTVKAAEECGCNVSPILGVEKNKMVADLLKSEDFKKLKLELEQEQYRWDGAHDIEIIKNNDNGMILIGVPFSNGEGTVEMFVFIDGVFVGNAQP